MSVMKMIEAHRTSGNMPIARAVIDNASRLAGNAGHTQFAARLEEFAAKLPAAETPRPAVRNAVVDLVGERSSSAEDVLSRLADAASYRDHDSLSNALDSLASVARAR